MKLTKTSIPIGFLLLQTGGIIGYISLYEVHSFINFIKLILFLEFNVGVIVVFTIVYYFYREKKKIWQIPFFIFLIFVGFSLLMDYLEIL